MYTRSAWANKFIYITFQPRKLKLDKWINQPAAWNLTGSHSHIDGGDGHDDGHDDGDGGNSNFQTWISHQFQKKRKNELKYFTDDNFKKKEKKENPKINNWIKKKGGQLPLEWLRSEGKAPPISAPSLSQRGNDLGGHRSAPSIDRRPN